MNFTTKVNVSESDFKINHCHKIAMIGSCFTQNIGDKLLAHKFDVSINPFGVLFNPLSVALAIKRCLNYEIYLEKELLKEGDKWLSLDHHSQFNSLKPSETLNSINDSIKKSETYYTNGDYLIITLGTAWVYEYLETNKVVANCHKINNSRFSKKLLSIESIVNVYSDLFNELITKNPKLKIIFTVSPVRHWKDGVVENNRSKSVLQLAIMNLISQFDFVSYFPSYEIVLDELRDYRFFKKDMLHPNEQAVDYIYQRFSDTYYTNETSELNNEIYKLLLALSHRPFNPNSKEHLIFLDKTKLKLKNLENQYPFLKNRMSV